MQSLQRTVGVHLCDVFSLDVQVSAGEKFLLLHTVTDDNDILKTLVVFFQCYVDGVLCSHLDPLCDETYIREYQYLVVASLYGEVSVQVCDCSQAGSLHLDRSTYEGLSVRG